MAKYTTNAKISFLIVFLFFVFGLTLLVVTSVTSYMRWKNHALHALQNTVETVSRHNVKEMLYPYEWVLRTHDNQIVATPLTTKMTTLPFFSHFTRYEDRYWIGYNKNIVAGDLMIYEEVTYEIVGQLELLRIGAILLLLLSIIAYMFTRGIIRYGFSGLDDIARYCTRITQYMRVGDSDVLETTALVSDVQSAEMHAVSTAIQAMIAQIYSYIQQQHVFTHGMSHEFKTQLMQVQSDLDVMKDEIQHPQAFQEIQASLRGFRDLVDQLLLLAMNEQDLQQQEMHDVSLGEIISGYIDDYAHIIQEHGFTVYVAVESDISIYPGLFGTLIRNIVSNMVKYTPDQGNIDIVLDDRILVCSNTVQDMTYDDIEHMFNLFWMKDRSRAGDRSHGIGTALIKKIIEIHGWTLSTTLKDDVFSLYIDMST